MGFLFRKRIRILPGIWFNLSKSGISTSIGGKGITINIKEGKVRTTASLPGTGISYRTTSTSTSDESVPTRTGIPGWVWVLVVVFVVVVFNVK
jgi:L,D-peptidoglycan transpeptidase YkuD (ErfK/YbiS/YcfS/YnhG family)